MIKGLTQLEHKVGDRTYQFICDQNSPLGEVHDALAKFKAYVVGVINAQDPKEEPKTE